MFIIVSSTINANHQRQTLSKPLKYIHSIEPSFLSYKNQYLHILSSIKQPQIRWQSINFSLINQSMETDMTFFQTEINSSKPIYFIHPHNKFWEVSADAENVYYRAGKMKNKQQITSQKLQKKYSSDYVAKRTVKQKIRQKLVKGYIFLQGSKPEVSIRKNNSSANQLLQKEIKESKKQQKEHKKKIKAVLQHLEERNKFNLQNNPLKTLNGSDYILLEQQINISEKDKLPIIYLHNSTTKESIKYEHIEEKKVKIIKYFQQKDCGYEIKSFASNEETMKFLFGQRQWLKSQGYKEEEWKELCQKQQKDHFVKKEGITVKKQEFKQKNSKTEKTKNQSLVSKTDDCLTQLHRLTSYSNQPFHNKEEPMLGPPSNGVHIKLMLAETWKEGGDPKGWLMSQKLDGVRCYWTGSQMYSRNGNKFQFPNFFVKNWPKAQLDGQLFIGRGKFSHTISTVKRLNPVNSMWENVRYLVFDAPGLKCPFKERYRIMKEVIQKSENPYIKCHFHRQCKGFQDMFNQLDHINKVEGEGLMLRDPNSLYEFKRSKALLKVKTFHDDEATIIGYNQGTGRFVGHIGSLKCINKAGAYFDVGSGLNDEMRYNPPKIGLKIVYKYQEINKDTGRPRFPTFLRMFEDESSKDNESVMGWVRDDDDRI